MLRLFFYQWTAVLVGAVTIVSVVGVVVFLLYRRYKQSSECPAHCTPLSVPEDICIHRSSVCVDNRT